MKIIPAGLIAEKGDMVSVNPWLYLIDLEVSDTETIYLVGDNAPATFNSIAYSPFPFVVGIIGEDSGGDLPTLVIQVSNASLELSKKVDENLGFAGRKVTIRIVNKDAGTSVVTEAFNFEYDIHDVKADRKRLTFVIGHDNLNEYFFPSKRLMRGRCEWVYSRNGTGRCQYRGTFETPVYAGGGTGTLTDVALISGVQTETITLTFVSAGPHWTFVGSLTGAKANIAPGAFNNGLMSGTLGGSPNDGDTFTIETENLDACDHTARGANGCERHQNIPFFGGAPGIPKD